MTDLNYTYYQKTNGLLESVSQKELCEKITVALKQQKQKGIYIHGSVGSGKTMIMDLAYAFFSKQKHRQHFKPFMIDVHQVGFDKTLKNFKSLKLLCLDELEILDIADAMVIKRLFEALTKQNTFIITTSNTKPQNLYHKGLHFDRFEPFIYFLESNFAIEQLDSDLDYRTLSVTHSKSTNLSDGELVELILKDQKIEVLQSNNHIAIQFKDLFNTSFGPYHYMELSKKHPVLWIQNTPSFCNNNQDLLRQLITLVDIYYDQGFKVILSPEVLINKDLNQPIQRFESRLHEMKGGFFFSFT